MDASEPESQSPWFLGFLFAVYSSIGHWYLLYRSPIYHGSERPFAVSYVLYPFHLWLGGIAKELRRDFLVSSMTMKFILFLILFF